MEEYSDIFSSPIEVPLHFQVKHPIDLTLAVPLSNGQVHHLLSVRKWGDQESYPITAPQVSHPSQLITLWEPNHASTEEIWDLATLN
jgi:hypothetical protein